LISCPRVCVVMAAHSRFGVELKLAVLALLRGCAQLAFCDGPLRGLLVLVGIALIAPFSALGVLLGAAFGTLVGRFAPAYRRDEWACGLASFNPAIVGLLWGGFLASGEVHIAFLLPLLALSMLLDVAFRQLLARLQLPALSIGAFTTVYLASLIAAPPGAWFWTEAPSNPLVPFGLMGAACIVAAMVMQCAFAALWALLLAAFVLLTGWLTGHDAISLVGLWALTVPLASFGVHAVFLRGALIGCIVGSVSASVGALIWIVWQATGLAEWLPPLLMPFILGVWLSIILMRPLSASPLANPAFWRVVSLLKAARAGDGPVVALVRDLCSAKSAASSFINGAWLDAQLPRDALSVEQLHASQPCRQRFWDACERLRVEAHRRPAGDIAKSLAKLQRCGWVAAIAVQDVPCPGKTAGAGDVVSLHGNAEGTLCLDCKACGEWPPVPIWRRCDLRCSCQGPLVPNITPFGGPLAEPAQNRLNELAEHCAAVLVVGEEACEPATTAFLEHARRRGAPVVFLSDGPVRHPRRAADLSVHASARACLELLYLVLEVWRIATHAEVRRSGRRFARVIRRADKAAG
jgi:urea transporter/NAD-dependent SIR2 family protein deacetylase